MNILGIGLSHSCGVCLIQNGRIVFAQEEDRFSRVRRQKGWPVQSLQFVFETFGLQEKDIDLCVLCDIQTAGRLKERINAKKTIVVHHHLAHVMSGWALTDYPDMDAVSLDGGGDLGSWQSYATIREREVVSWESNCGYHLNRQQECTRSRLRLHRMTPRIGKYWSVPCIVNFGMVDHNGVAGYEGKLMGLAAHGNAANFDPVKENYDVRFKVRRGLRRHWICTKGYAKLGDPEFCNTSQGKISLQELRRMRKEEHAILCEYELSDPDNRRFAADFGAYLQALTDKVVCEAFERNFSSDTPVVVSGGLFSNVVLNGVLNRKYKLFVAPCMGDDGLALGAAAWGAYVYGLRYLNHDQLYLGYDAGSNASVNCREVAQLLADDKVVGLIEGRMELGPRALGARTILADPQNSNVNWTINERLGRVEYMPFAPVIMKEHAPDLLDGWTESHLSSQHMTLTYKVKPNWRTRIKGVVHVDHTVRPQVIDENTNPVYFRILSEFYKITGIPALINTSFNRHGEPILATVEHGLQALRDNRVDVLVAGDKIHYQ